MSYVPLLHTHMGRQLTPTLYVGSRTWVGGCSGNPRPIITYLQLSRN